MQNMNDLPSSQPHPPDQGMPKRGRGGRVGSVIALLLAAAIVFSVGLFAGWQFGRVNTRATGTSGAIATTPPVNGNDVEAVREAVIAKVRPSVVQINVETDKGVSLGSGEVIDPQGNIVTNNHVVAGARRLQVVFYNGTTLPAKVVGTAPQDDLAVVQVNPSNVRLTVIKLGDSSNLRVGQSVLAIGNPLGITQTVTSGIVSALNRNVSTGSNGSVLPGTIQTDAPINPGNSGGALVDLQGELVGVPTLTAIDPEFKTPANGVGFAIPVNRVKFIAPQLIKNGRVVQTGRAALGVEVATVDAVAAQQNQLPVDHGAIIASVTQGGPAAQAGLKAGDIIVQVDNTPIVDTSSLNDVLLNKSPGDTVRVTVYRGSQQLTVSVKLGELPPQ